MRFQELAFGRFIFHSFDLRFAIDDSLECYLSTEYRYRFDTILESRSDCRIFVAHG